MALTTDQLTDFQADLGIGNDQSVFTDAELQRLFTRAGEDYSLAVVLALRQLMTSAAKLNDYTVGQTEEKRSQIFKQLKEALEYHEEKVDAAQQFAITGLRSTPPVAKEMPAGEPHPDLKNRRHNDSLYYNKYRRRRRDWWD